VHKPAGGSGCLTFLDPHQAAGIQRLGLYLLASESSIDQSFEMKDLDSGMKLTVTIPARRTKMILLRKDDGKIRTLNMTEQRIRRANYRKGRPFTIP
jgi:hypothetical protein